MKKIILVLILFSMGCDEDPIFGLERGWLYGDDNGTSSDSNDVPPDDECNIIYYTNGSTYDFISPNQTLYRYGDSYTVTLHSNIFSVGQVSAVYLYLTEIKFILMELGYYSLIIRECLHFQENYLGCLRQIVIQ